MHYDEAHTQAQAYLTAMWDCGVEVDTDTFDRFPYAYADKWESFNNREIASVSGVAKELENYLEFHGRPKPDGWLV